MRRIVSWIAPGSAGALLFVFAALSVADLPKIGDRKFARGNRSRDKLVQAAARSADDKRTEYVPLHLKFRTAAQCEAECKKLSSPIHVFLRAAEFAGLLVQLDPTNRDRNAVAAEKLIDDLFAREALEWYDFDPLISVPPPRDGGPSQAAARASEPIIRGGLKGYTGKGSIVCVIDSGVDFRHPDFRTALGKSRMLWYWDTQMAYKAGRGQPGPYKYPNGTPIGTLFSRDDLSTMLTNGKDADGPRDFDGHGTACAGVAVGNGQAREAAAKTNPKPELQNADYRGVAPNADIIGIRFTNDDGDYAGSWLLAAAAKWLDEAAGAKPLVVSCSWGGLGGQYDGAKVQEQMLGRILPPDKKGRVVCFAGGNEGDYRRHTAVTIGKDQPGVIRWASTNSPDTKDAAPDAIDLLITDVLPEWIAIKPLEGAQVQLDGPPAMRGHFNDRGDLVHVTLKQSLLSKGNGGVRIEATDKMPSGQLRVDAYMFSRLNRGFPVATFRNASNTTQIGEPATADSVICVGSYNFNDTFLGQKGLERWRSASTEEIVPGEISMYSNGGFSRPFERFDSVRSSSQRLVKPELVAPGQWHTAAASSNVSKRDLDLTGKYIKHNGTSAATPYTAGFVALLMEKNPQLSADDFRALLKRERMLTNDNFTGAVPNPQWGYGKLDLKAAERILDAWK